MHNDAIFVRWNYTDQSFTELVSAGLCARLSDLERDPGVHLIMVCTQVPAFLQQSAIFRGDNPVMRSFFAVPSLGQKIETFSKVTTVVSGHTHRRVKPVPVARGSGADLTLATIGGDYYQPRFELFRIWAPDRACARPAASTWRRDAA